MPKNKNEISEEDAKTMVLKFQILQENLRTLEAREERLLNHFDEMEITRQALEDLSNVKKENALFPLGSGDFISGQITDTENIIVSIGGGIAMKKSRKEAQEVLDGRIEEVKKVIDDMSQQRQSIISQLTKLQAEIENSRR